MSIFKAYDIRGLYPAEINEKIAYKIGRAFVEFLKCSKVVVGRDCRIGSDKLFDALAKGITDQGADVIDIGLCTTPELYFAAIESDAIMITASHDPKEYNGLKMCKKGDIPLGKNGTGLAEIEKLSEENKFTKPKKKGKITKKNIVAKYIKHVRKFKKKLKQIKVVADAGNGMAGLTVPKVFKGLPVKIIPLFFELDGSFPNRDPNPKLPEHLSKLKKEVVRQKAECGMAFDGDADRIIFIDEKGNWIRPDFIGLLIAKKLLEKKPHAKILYDLTSSWAAREGILEIGGIPMMSRVGHTYIKQGMREEEAEFAFEVSGHYYFKENHYSDSGIIAAMLLLSILSEEKKKLSELIKPFQKYQQSGEINLKVENVYHKMKELEEQYKSRAVKLYHLDGLTVEFDDWWFNIRASHTEPLLRINIEAKTKKLLEQKEKELMKIISQNSLKK